ncbi:TadE/TadG family type IV pilus assembly protein [Phenylobacterium soli]|uniref:Pilus assembly protein n=1 Tax=Phenylobacterium soli TaxID=2170551 RepID=A0A328AB69_9CAUL|nr:TadE/TadG family type IV pilus assembly protein [Phenylobacterium soli]RAK51819.1 pilus assembly protein [Phenylobacterium soli]
MCSNPLHPAAARRQARTLLGDRRGAAAVEFALVAPILLLLMAGLVDGSRLIAASMQVNSAAQAGADFALRNGWNQAGTAAAVSAAASGLDAPGVALSQGCVANATLTAAAGATCPDGRAPGRYVTVTASAPYRSVMRWPGVALPSSVSAKAVVRVP